MANMKVIGIQIGTRAEEAVSSTGTRMCQLARLRGPIIIDCLEHYPASSLVL